MSSNQAMHDSADVAVVPATDADHEGDISDNTSDTSSYHSGDEQERHLEEVKISEEIINQHDMVDEFEEPSVSSYAKFKSQNEIDLENIDKYAPAMPALDDLDDIIEFGIVDKYIEDGPNSYVTVKPLNPQQIYDLDNIVCNKQKEVVGFILDLVGPINQPLYSIRIYPKYIEKLKSQNIEVKNQLLESKIYLVVKTLKVINAQLPVIMNKKGCDASNIYDEELPENDREFSDDEKEREWKKAKKLKRKARQQGPQPDREMEEGEIEEPVT